MRQRRKNGATPIDLATDGDSRDILDHHAAVMAAIRADPAALVSYALAHCASLSGAQESVPAPALPLRAYQLDPFFLWAPEPAFSATVFAWAPDAVIPQLAGTSLPFRQLNPDCEGDILEFFNVAMTREDALHVATHCSSQEACAWVRAVITAAAVAAVVARPNMLSFNSIKTAQ